MTGSRIVARLFAKGLSLLVPAILAGQMAGCAPSKVGPTGPVFFPPPPNEPRIQFLKGITDSTDIEDEQSTFSFILTGKEKGTLIKNIGKGYGIRVHKGKLYISGSGSGEIIIIDPVKRSFDYFTGSKGEGRLVGPVNLTFDDEGYMYVADPPRREVVVYDPAGNYVRSVGKGIQNTRYVDVAVYGGKIYVLDGKGGLVRVFDRKSGEEIDSFGKSDNIKESLAIPTNFALGPDSNLYISTLGHGKIFIFDRDGHLLNSFGRIGDSFGEFSRPRGIAVNSAGWIYVVDAGHGNVQLFNEKNQLLTFFGNTAGPGVLNLPAGIAVTRDNLDYFQQFAAPGFKLEELIFVLNQYGSPKISIYGLGQMQK